MTLQVAVLGLGEAGGTIASDLVRAGCVVRGWDPVSTAVPAEVERSVGAREAVAGSDLVLSLTTAAHAVEAASDVAAALAFEQVYADMNTTLPTVKCDVAAVVERAGAAFSDVALLGPVPARGLQTPALASGDGAERFVELLRPFGMPVEVVGDEPGDAAGLKLLRSVFMKGLAASVFESMEAAKVRGAADWLRGEIVDVLGQPLLQRLLSGTVTHAGRRLDEMEAAATYLEGLGVEPRVARASAEWLEELLFERKSRSAAGGVAARPPPRAAERRR
jgi:3-hydroxyisobutyrate dehydrogenase-like beta-hydroxyacid dehydrogenase